MAATDDFSFTFWLADDRQRFADHQTLYEHLTAGTPALVNRLGSGEVALCYNPQDEDVQRRMARHVGVAPPSAEMAEVFVKRYTDALLHTTLLTRWYASWFASESPYVIQHLGSLEDGPHAETLGDITAPASRSWTRALVGKRVLVIHPFSRTMKRQYELGRAISHVQQTRSISFLKAPQTASDDETTWEKMRTKNITFKTELERIETYLFSAAVEGRLDHLYDVVLLGCGGYAACLADTLKTRLQCSAVVMGGALQLYFRIRGRRWETEKKYAHVLAKMELEHEWWVRPDESEKIECMLQIENGCYW